MLSERGRIRKRDKVLGKRFCVKVCAEKFVFLPGANRSCPVRKGNWSKLAVVTIGTDGFVTAKPAFFF